MDFIKFFTSYEFIIVVFTGLLLLIIMLLIHMSKLIKSTKQTNSLSVVSNVQPPMISDAGSEEGKYNTVNKLLFKSSDGSEVELKRANKEMLQINIDDYIQLPSYTSSLTDGIASTALLSNGIATATQAGAISLLNSNGFFTATVSPELLTKFGDGTFSTMIHGSEGIIGHAGFQASSAAVFAPIIVFQAMSMITGQYYLNGITKQLTTIDKKINKLLELHHVERLTKIKHTTKLIKRLCEIEHPNVEDMLALKIAENDMSIIHEEYVHLLSTIDLEDLKTSTKWRTSSKINELYSKVNDSDFDFNLNMAITTDEILHLLRIIELMMNTKMSDNVTNRAKRVGEVIKEIKTWDSNEFYRTRFGDKSIADFYSTIINKALEIFRDSIINQEKAYAMIGDFIMKESELEESVGGKILALEMGKKIVEQLNQPVEVAFIVADNQPDQILIKK